MSYWVVNNILVKMWYVCASLSLALLAVACHNYIHRKTNWRMYIFNMSMVSYRIIFIFLHKGYFKTHYRWHDALGLTLPIWMWITTGAPVLQVISTWLSINCIGSFIFTSIAVSVSHHHPDVIKDGDQPRSGTPNWRMHQIDALLHRKDVTNNVFAVITLFGDHTLHHMFLTLDYGVLRHQHPIFIEICEKFQANYQVSTQCQLLLVKIKETTRTEFKTIKQCYT